MPSRFVSFAISILLASLAGCAAEWVRPGTTEQELNADKLSCEQAAMRQYPVQHDAPVSYRPAASSKLETSCVQQSGFNNCDAAGTSAPSVNTQESAVDYNRAAAVKACLISKGYTYRKTAP